MGLVDKLIESGKRARGLALAGVLGSSVYLSGCGPALMGLGAGTPGARGAALYAFGSGVTQLEAAEAGKSEVKQTVNVNGGNGGTRNFTPENHSDIVDGQNKFFTCNYYKGDLNGNGVLDESEFVGYGKKKFYPSEKLNFSWDVFNRKGACLTLDILGPNNKYSGYGGSHFEQHIIDFDRELGVRECIMSQNVEGGKYLAIWKIGDEIIGTADFEIVNDNSTSFIPKNIKAGLTPYKLGMIGRTASILVSVENPYLGRLVGITPILPVDKLFSG